MTKNSKVRTDEWSSWRKDLNKITTYDELKTASARLHKDVVSQRQALTDLVSDTKKKMTTSNITAGLMGMDREYLTWPDLLRGCLQKLKGWLLG